MRFIVIKKNEIAFGTGLDACEICGDSGYFEDKGKVICRECDVMMNIQTIGFPGGCNPIPIAYEIDGGKLLVPALKKLLREVDVENGRIVFDADVLEEVGCFAD